MIVKKSIRTQLVVSLIVLSVIPLLLLGAILTWQNYVTQQQQAKDLQAEASKRALNKIQAILGELESELTLLTKTHRLMDLSYDQQYTALSIYRSHKTDSNREILNEIALLDSTGKEIVRISRSEIITKNDLKMKSSTYEFLMPFKTGKPFYSSIFFNEKTSEPFMIISMPIINIQKDSIEGVIIANVRLNFLWDLLATVPVGKSGIAYLTDTAGQVIAHPNPSVVLKGSYIEVPITPGIRTGLNGTKVVSACQQIQIGSESLHIVTERPVSEALAQTYRSTITIAIFLLLTLGGIIAFAYVVVLRIVRPIETLSKAAEAISCGDLTQQASISNPDEIGALAGTFNDMTSNLVNTIGSFKDSHERLLLVLDSLDSVVYVADIKTYEILFINKHTKDVFGDIEGQICWKGLQSGQTGPCEFCSNDKLLNPEGTPADSYQWEFQNTINNSWYYIHDRAIYWVDGRLARLEIATDITESKKTEEILRNISETATVEIGEAFFQSLAGILCRTLETEYAFIGKTVDDTYTTIQTLAVCASGKIVDNFQYDLAGSPCGGVVGKTFCSYPANVQKAFPEDLLLSEMGVESYIGTPLFDSRKRPIGILVVMDNKPLKNEELVRSLFEIFAARTASEIERLRVDKLLIASERKYRDLMETAVDAILIADVETGIFVDANKSAEELTGWTISELMRMHQPELHPSEDLKQATKDFRAHCMQEHSFSSEVRILRKDGHIIPVEITTNIIESDGRKLIQGILRDITERKVAADKINSSLSEKEVLLKEIHHRVKNNMQVISSLLNLQSEYIDNKKYLDMFYESRNRIRAMALVHEKLYQSSDLTNISFNNYITSLASGLQVFYGISPNNIHTEIDVHGVNLPIDTAIPCGLIINELLSNAMKHAFPIGEKGEVKLIFKQVAANGNSTYELKVKDNGIGIPDNINIRKSRSLGLQLVTNLAEHQLQGTIKLNREKGTEFTISFKELIYNKRI